MTNYTYEQRKMIAEYLEKMINDEEVCLYERDDDGERFSLGDCVTAIPSDDILRIIKELKTVTFGDIREKTGISFIYPPINKDYPLTILKEFKTNRLYVGFFKFGYVYEVNDLDDSQKVEVINETETA